MDSYAFIHLYVICGVYLQGLAVLPLPHCRFTLTSVDAVGEVMISLPLEAGLKITCSVGNSFSVSV